MKTIRINEKNRVKKIEESLYFNIKNHYKQSKNMVLVFIGTDKCTGESLGPLIGTKLEKRKGIKSKVDIYGTLNHPIHSMNLEDTFNEIDEETNLIIVIDAALSGDAEVGDIIIDTGSIFPGIAVGKKLTPRGDISISGIIGKSENELNMEILFSTRLAIVYNLAEEIELSLNNVIKRIQSEKALKLATTLL